MEQPRLPCLHLTSEGWSPPMRPPLPNADRKHPECGGRGRWQRAAVRSADPGCAPSCSLQTKCRESKLREARPLHE